MSSPPCAAADAARIASSTRMPATPSANVGTATGLAGATALDPGAERLAQAGVGPELQVGEPVPGVGALRQRGGSARSAGTGSSCSPSPSATDHRPPLDPQGAGGSRDPGDAGSTAPRSRRLLQHP